MRSVDTEDAGVCAENALERNEVDHDLSGAVTDEAELAPPLSVLPCAPAAD
jgi:hypothetical protein